MDSGKGAEREKRFVNPFTSRGKWYKANLHTHTTTSDGALSAAERVKQYRKAGYGVLAITDHGTTSDVRGMSDKRLLVISGSELHPPCPTHHNYYHLVALNVPHGFEPSDLDDANRCIEDVRAAGGETILAHPSWNAHGYEEFKDLKGLVAVEIYNSLCGCHGRPSSEALWDLILDRGMRLPCVGVDDTHSAYIDDVFETWTWLKMPSLSVRNVLKALRTGACYASRGPKIHDFRVKGRKAIVRCSPVQEIHFCYRSPWGIRRRAEEGKSITTFSVELPDVPLVRAMATDSAGRRAWTNPIWLNDL